MGRIPAAQLEKSLAKGESLKDRLPVYLLYGADASRIQSVAELIKNKIVENIGGQDNYFRVLKLGDGAEETSPVEVVAQLNTVSMFGDGKLMWVGPLDGLNKNMAAPLTQYAANPNPASTLIITLVAERKDSLKSLEGSAFFASVDRIGAVTRFDRMRAKDLGSWVKKKLGELGVSVDMPAAQMMAQYQGKDTRRLAMEIEKAAAFAGYGGSLSAQDVEEVMTDTRMEEVWGFTGAFCSGDLAGSQVKLNQLLENGFEPQIILKTLSLEVMKAAAAGDMKASGGSKEEFVHMMGENPFSLRSAWEKGRLWNMEKANKALSSIFKAQMDMMTAGVSADTAMTRLLLEGIPGKPR